MECYGCVDFGVYCFLKKSFFVSAFLPVIILCMCAKSLIFSSSDELWWSLIDDSAFSFFLILLGLLLLIVVNCEDSGELSVPHLCYLCVWLCMYVRPTFKRWCHWYLTLKCWPRKWCIHRRYLFVFVNIHNGQYMSPWFETLKLLFCTVGVRLDICVTDVLCGRGPYWYYVPFENPIHHLGIRLQCSLVWFL